MTLRDNILTGILLLLIGIMVGLIFSLFQFGNPQADLAEVRFTEVNRSDLPLWTDEELSRIDDRFVFRTIAERVTPTVVYIETVVPTRNQRLEREDESDDSIWRRFMPPRAQTVGSGVLISSDGYILTNNHVIDNAVRDGISVTLFDKREYEAVVIGQDPSTDLAVIKINSQDVPSITVGNSDQVKVGEWVLAIGNPFRLRSTVTAGIVSALSRDVEIIDDLFRVQSFIQTDAAINRGNSGGALVNTSGDLIGINTAIATQNGNYQGYGFAVPSNLAMKVAKDLIEFGDVKRGMLGVTIQSVDNRIASRTGLNRIQGVAVMSVQQDGAAGRSDVRSNDIVLAVNGNDVNESNQLQERVAMYRPGDVVTLTIWRDGKTIEKEVTLKEAERPEPEPITLQEEEIIPNDRELNNGRNDRGSGGIDYSWFDHFGFSTRGLASPEDPDSFDFYVHRIEPGSKAEQRGLPLGSRILDLNGAEVTTPDQLEKIVRDAQNKSRSLTLRIETESGSTGTFILD